MIENTISIDSQYGVEGCGQPEATELQKNEQGVSDKVEDMPEGETNPEENTIEEEMFDLTVYGESVKLPKSQAVGAAQKGMAFESMKQKLALAKNDVRLKALDSLAQISGKSVSHLLGDMTSQALTKQLEDKYGELALVPQEELEQVIQKIHTARVSAEEAADRWKLEEKRNQLEEFLQHNPGCTDIPQQVIDRVKQGENLSFAYSQYSNQQLLQQIEQLQRELSVLKSGRAAKEKSMPAARSTATGHSTNSIYGMMRSLW